MKVITIESEAYKALIRKIDRIVKSISESKKKKSEPDPNGVWVNNDEACEFLNISGRTLQRLRSGGQITYSIRGGKVYYTLTEVKRLLSGRVVNHKTKGGDQ